MPRIKSVELGHIIRLRQRINSVREIADILNLSKSSVARALHRNAANGTPRYRYGGGRRKTTTARQDRAIVRCAVRNRVWTAGKIRANLQINNTCPDTIRNRLHDQGYRARRRANCPLLSPNHRLNRRRWANEHLLWDVQWRHCLFTDECRFNLYQSDGRMLTWRRRGEKFLEENMRGQVAFGGGGITVWGGIQHNGKTELAIFRNRNVNARVYLEECLRTVVLPHARNYGDDFVLVDDNARPHRAILVNEYLQAQNVNRMELPSRSPDMNPIEHVWSWMKLELAKREPQPENQDQLEALIIEIWDEVPAQFINNLISSMPRRCRTVLQNRGGPTNY